MNKQTIAILLIIVLILGNIYIYNEYRKAEENLNVGIKTGFYYGVIYQLNTNILTKEMLVNINVTTYPESKNRLECQYLVLNNSGRDFSEPYIKCLELALNDTKSRAIY